ncbi:DoxX family protein [Kiloniella laminariae]|uniref:DoxX family protein n=1 Tax=Kiloniella laminariae TaxID=454162 RepID=UPI0003676B29|nr:DoxX family protein [Kiloniella laminariae]
MSSIKKILPYLLAIFIAYVFLRYLPFKFASGSHLFQVLEDWSGLAWFEPHGRYLTGGAELLACILLFIPRLQALGGLLSLALMTGAIFFHVFTPLGIDPYNDGGKLFTQAVGVWFSGLIIIFLRRDEYISLLKFLLSDPKFSKEMM